jgi:hypothetical protein
MQESIEILAMIREPLIPFVIPSGARDLQFPLD